MKNFTSSTNITTELDIDVSYSYYPGCEAVMTLPSGDPGYPAEAAELEVTDIRIGRGKDRISILKYFSDEEIEAIASGILEDGIDTEPDYDEGRD